mmetsp:Transcript_13624/g.33990  ORF Transcript_13624/g.33990 Transcript_13624/m.33990 type:complete len:106 (+) Transcript_13624:1714-2031(+)
MKRMRTRTMELATFKVVLTQLIQLTSLQQHILDVHAVDYNIWFRFEIKRTKLVVWYLLLSISIPVQLCMMVPACFTEKDALIQGLAILMLEPPRNSLLLQVASTE